MKIEKSDIKAKLKFYYWAKKRGIDLKNFDPERISFNPKKQISTFKKNKTEIKEKHNYKFKHLQIELINS